MIKDNTLVNLNIRNQIHQLVFEGQYDYDKSFTQTFACVYIITKQTNIGRNIIYVGQTEDINQRLSNHHKKDCWKKYANSNALYIYQENNQANRLYIESLIIQQYNPPCNG